jgi:uncharacterized protein YegP (UPF0339 family)
MPNKTAYRSELLGALHETMADLFKAGKLSAAKMRDYDAMCLVAQPNPSATEITVRGVNFEVFKDRNGAWRWHMIDKNGRVLAVSGEGFPSKTKATSALEIVVKAFETRAAA